MILNFSRREVKYRLNAAAFGAVLEEWAPHLREDKYPAQKIHNVYYDTVHDEIITRSIAAPIFKEKLRLRAYENDGKLFAYAFLELKRKYEGIVYKRRLELPLHCARALIGGAKLDGLCAPSQIQREILFFIKKTACYPKLYIRYDRLSYVGRCDRGLRVTFDSNIGSRSEALGFAALPSDRPLLEEGEVIMEIKSDTSFPLWLAHSLTGRRIFPTSFSKYGRIFERDFSTR